MKTPLLKYQMGLAALGAFALAVLIVVLVQAGATKTDNETATAAQKVANKLNEYLNTSETVPESFAAAGISDVPKTITYQKISSSAYKFCVNYKSTSSSFNSTLLAEAVASGAVNSSGYDAYDTVDSSFLYLPASHHKGANCQTIKPYLQFSSSDYPSAKSSSSDPVSVFNTQDIAKDTERKTDMRALQGQLEAYFAQNGYYPTLTNVNDASWRATNMKGLDPSALADPNSKSMTLTSLPTKNAYSYYVTTDTGTICDNIEKDCTKYVLTATLADTTAFTLESLN